MLSASALLLAGFAAAKTCTNFTIPVDISSRQGLFKNITTEQNLEATKFAQEFTNIGQNYTDVLLQGYQTLVGTFSISAKFCQPDGGSNSSVVQLLSHGIGFDKSYWDLPFNNFNYSYTENAIGNGYSTLAIDRLGIGNSSHGDPLNAIQAQAEIEALNAITTKLRNGGIPEIGCSFSKVVHVGHSFGSVQSYWLSALYPGNTDGLVLTGWSANSSYLPITVASWNLHVARLNQPLRFGNASSDKVRSTFAQYASSSALVSGLQTLLQTQDVELSSQDIWNEIATTEVGNLITGFNQSGVALYYPSGYLTWPDFTSNQFAFLLPGYYDIGLGLVSEATKQPVTTGELLTIGSAPSSTAFTGPVFVITGEQDVPFCGGDCFATGGVAPNIPAEAAPLFPSASVFEAYIQPNTAHGINAHYNATAAYQVVSDWLAAHGLAA